MNLKKAFQYQKLIKSIQQEIVVDAMDEEKFEVVEENHKRSELNFYFNYANKTYSDELKVRKSKNVRGYDFAKLVMVYEYLVSCREKLAEAISEVKNGMSIGPEGLSYDAAVLRNSDLRELEFRCRAFSYKVEEEDNNTASLNFTQDSVTQVLNMLNSIDAVVVLIIVCAASLAFVVLYNLSNINIAERVKEIATIKVLGFYDPEVYAYVNRESIALTLIGTLLGLAGGIALHSFVITTVEVDAVMFGRQIYAKSFVYAVVLTLLFSVLVNLVMQRLLQRISMVESMKAPE